MPAPQAFLVILTGRCTYFLLAIRIVKRMVCLVVRVCMVRALTSERQHFLKQDTVFLDLLVYSECSAFRFPSARND